MLLSLDELQSFGLGLCELGLGGVEGDLLFGAFGGDAGLFGAGLGLESLEFGLSGLDFEFLLSGGADECGVFALDGVASVGGLLAFGLESLEFLAGLALLFFAFGAVVLLTADEASVPTQTEIKLVQVAASFLGKQMEE